MAIHELAALKPQCLADEVRRGSCGVPNTNNNNYQKVTENDGEGLCPPSPEGYKKEMRWFETEIRVRGEEGKEM